MKTETGWLKVLGWCCIVGSVLGVGDFIFFGIKNLYATVALFSFGVYVLIRERQERRGK